jgi:large subunit ribosomal protein L24e
MPRCDFCKKKIEPGTGKKYVKNDGKVLDFCSSKCEKSTFKLKRKPREWKWTIEYQRAKEK